MESIKELEESLFQKLKDNPLDFNTLNKLGYIYLHSNNLLKSEEFYTRSVYIEPNQFEPYVSLGLICTITLRLGKALYYLMKAKEKNPDSPDLLKSIEEINTAIINKDSKLNNDELNHLIDEANYHLEKNNIEEAIESYLRLMNIYTDNETILLNLGISFLKKKDFILAYDLFKQLIEKFPGNAMAFHYAGITANFLNEINEAREYLQKALEIKPSLADILSSGKFAHNKKDYSEEEISNCPNCNKQAFTPVEAVNQSASSFNFNIVNPLRFWVACNNCGLTFCNPRPAENALQKYALELYYYSINQVETDLQKVILENNAYNERLNRIEKYVSTGKCIDLKSDYGIFLSLAKMRGWSITGLEDNELKIERINEIQELEIKNFSFKNFKSNENFDLVTLWENIEKIPDFLTVFRKAHKLLKKGGLFAFSFHGKDTYLARVLGSDYPLWTYPDYLYYFESKILRDQLEKIGFEIVDIQVTARNYLSNVEFYCRK